jgi:Flp pilus assembly protein TadB
MAQTKRKRRTKHRGNAAGSVEVRGRTGRPPTPEERKKQERELARNKRAATPPTWRSAVNKAALISALMFVLLMLTSKGKVLPSLAFVVIAMIIYVPLGYYLDTWMWKRRLRRQGPQAR